MKLEDNKGITGVDVAIAIVIIMIFVSFITSLFYNLANVSKRIQRNTTATNIAIQVIEAMKITDFATLKSYTANQKQVTSSELASLTGSSIIIPKGYTVKISISNPKVTAIDPDGNTEIGNVIQVISSEVSYSSSRDLDNDGTIDIETIKLETLVKDI